MPVTPAEVLHTGTLNDRPLRFFKSPLDGPDLPWVSSEDLGKALDLPRKARRLLARTPSHVAAVRTVLVAGDLVDIVPHCAAQGLIMAAVEIRVAVPSTFGRYTVAVAAAGKALTAHMPAIEGVAYLVEAFRRHGETTA